ncbi:hypothetical protein [Lichenibacterium ramalinae]|uniref:BA14K family protein n=1 Tax=Lichenibacterium ramalinae TaxID=2316527 RepID=A0A4Q2RDI2_9HYPH|nr:hypothetical protein [Lichenibacterium ramalinae]RYB03298.1 hypothetical protein D3272_17940 [Lichenibacterium ramalinae]
MNITWKGMIVGTLALAGATFATAEADAMPVQPLTAGVSAAQVEPVYYYRYGYRRPFLRYGYGVRRPFYGYRRLRPYGFRRPFYGYRRPFYGYGYRRF